MSDQNSGHDFEFAAIQTVFEALKPLDSPSRERVLEYIAARLEISTDKLGRTNPMGSDSGKQVAIDEKSTSEEQVQTLAELHDATGPMSDKERVLVAAYWLQNCQGADSFLSYEVNKALKDLGHGVSNITGTVDALRRIKPALILQLKKAGKTRQARKTYKITSAGITAVEEMIRG